MCAIAILVRKRHYEKANKYEIFIQYKFYVGRSQTKNGLCSRFAFIHSHHVTMQIRPCAYFFVRLRYHAVQENRDEVRASKYVLHLFEGSNSSDHVASNEYLESQSQTIADHRQNISNQLTLHEK